MKNAVFAFAAFAATAASAALYLPQTSERTSRNYPLGVGEIAYTPQTNGTAAAFVGNGSADPLALADPLSIRGYREATIDRASISVSYDDGITYNAAQDAWWWTGPTGVTYRLMATCPNGTRVKSFTYATGGANSSGIPGAGLGGKIYSVVTNGNVILIEGALVSGSFCVSNLEVVAEAQEAATIDLNELHIPLRDSVGEGELGGWRMSVLHAYDGNRGEDWTSYPARKAVRLGGHRVDQDSAGDISVGMDCVTTNFSIAVLGHAAVEVWHNPLSRAVTVTNFVHAGLADTFYFDQTGVTDANDFQVQYASNAAELSAESWPWVPARQITCAAGSVTVTWPSSSAMRCYRLFYHNEIVDSARVIVRAPLVLEGGLFLRGEDSVLYRITVNGGAISATAVD